MANQCAHIRSKPAKIQSQLAPTQRLADTTAWKHRQEYPNMTARWDSSLTADQRPCDVGARERGVTWRVNAPTLTQDSLRTCRNSTSAAPTQQLADITAWKHRQEYPNMTARWDSSPTADQQPCDVEARERGMMWQVIAPTLARDWPEFKVSCPHNGSLMPSQNPPLLRTGQFSSSAALHAVL